MRALRCIGRLRSGLGKARSDSRRRFPLSAKRSALEALEDRQLLSTFTVTNLHHAGEGSLRSAIVEANARPGPDTIDFGVAGTIPVGRASLPAITGAVTIDGTTAPSFAGTPVVTIDFRGTRGLDLRQRLRRVGLEGALAGPRRQCGRHAECLVRHGAGE